MKKVIVTGGSRGLGLEIVRELMKSGFFVINVSRSKTPELAEAMSKFANASCHYEFDFSDKKRISDLVRKITQIHGRIFGLVNNAAIGHDGVLATMHEDDISSVISLNVEAPILLTKYVSRSMLMGGEGRVVNVGSIIGSTGFNGLSVYGASKAALEGFSRSLARELGRANVTVNTLAPGYMKTDMTSSLQGDKLEKIERRSCLGRLASVQDAASMVIFLLSEQASGITGATFTVDAGSTA